MHTLKLIRPTQEYADQVMAYRQEMLDNGDSLDGCAALEDTNSYAEWADFEGRLRERYGEGYVPSDVYLAVRKSDDRLVGMIDFRRPLTEFLLRFGGEYRLQRASFRAGKGLRRRDAFAAAAQVPRGGGEQGAAHMRRGQRGVPPDYNKKRRRVGKPG